MTSTSLYHLICLCGTISEPGSLLKDANLPVNANICHCNTCRYTTGSLFASFPALKSAPSETTLAKLTAYHSSDFITRYFCSICGGKCFLYQGERGEWFCFGGVIERLPLSSSTTDEPRIEEKVDNIVKATLHEYIDNTIDCGIAPFLLNLGGRSIPTYSASPSSTQISHETITSLVKNLSKEENIPKPLENDYLQAKCHCGGVSLLIKRGNYSVSTGQEGKEKERNVPTDPKKWLSYLCACRSCRLSFGSSLTPWTLVVPEHVFTSPSSSSSHTQNLETTLTPAILHPPRNSTSKINTDIIGSSSTLKYHWSSPDTCRSFCGKCGASVSYWSEKRPEEVDLASGIFRAREGSMARGWLEWRWGRCSFIEECVDGDISKAWVASGEVVGGCVKTNR